MRPQIDYQGRYACIYKKKQTSTPEGFFYLGVGSALCPPEANVFWAPKKLNIGDIKALVTLENPPAFGLCPQISSVILTPVEDSLIAQMIIDRERLLAEMTYGEEKVRAKFNEKYVQLELGILNMPTNINEFNSEGF